MSNCRAFKERDVNAAYTCLVILNLARYHKVVMLSEVTVNTKGGANAWKKRGAQHPWSLQRDQGPGLTGWTAPLKKAASDGVGLSGNELGRGPQAAQKRPSLRFWACCAPQLMAGEKGRKAVSTHPRAKMVSGILPGRRQPRAVSASEAWAQGQKL